MFANEKTLDKFNYLWYNTIIGGEEMIWYEFEYNKPYHRMTMQQRLRYEDDDSSYYEELCYIEEMIIDKETDEWTQE